MPCEGSRICSLGPLNSLRKYSGLTVHDLYFQFLLFFHLRVPHLRFPISGSPFSSLLFSSLPPQLTDTIGSSDTVNLSNVLPAACPQGQKIASYTCPILKQPAMSRHRILPLLHIHNIYFFNGKWSSGVSLSCFRLHCCKLQAPSCKLQTPV